MSSDFVSVAWPIILAASGLVVGLFIGAMIGRRSMKKHLDAAPIQVNELSAQLAAAMDTSAKWQDASQKWQSASESWETASLRYEEATESLGEVVRLKDLELEAKDRTILALEQEIESTN